MSRNEVSESFHVGSGDIKSFMDARRFLLTDSANKNIADRLISYLVCLKITKLPPKLFPNDFIFIIESYMQYKSFYFSQEMEDPLSIIKTKSAKTMATDFTRTVTLFDSIAKENEIEKICCEKSIQSISRIFAILSKEHPDRFYMQGFDRFAFIYYALSLLFCQNYNLSNNFAEAITYHLLFHTLIILPMSKLIVNQPELSNHFDYLTKILMNYDRSKYNLLTSKNLSLLLFGVRYEALLFIDEHNLDDGLRIWDQIFARLENLDDVIGSFTLAHVHNIKITGKYSNPIEEIQHYKNWDIT